MSPYTGGLTTSRQVAAEAKRALIWDAVLAGKDQWEIAKELGCTQQAISKQVVKSIKSWQASTLCKVDQYIANELLRVNYGESQAWKVHDWAERAWHKSKGIVKVVNKRAKPVPVYQDGKPVMLTNGQQQTAMEAQSLEVKEETKVGNAQFLKAMLKAQGTAMQWANERRKLLGLDQPQKFKVQFPTLAEIEGMTDDELIDAVANGAYANNAVSAKLKEMFASMPGSDNGKGNGNGHGPN